MHSKYHTALKPHVHTNFLANGKLVFLWYYVKWQNEIKKEEK